MSPCSNGSTYFLRLDEQVKSTKKILLSLLITLSPALIPVSVFAEGDPDRGKAIYTTCATCHGQNAEGLEATNSPGLAGLKTWYLVNQLQKFRAGLRGENPDDKFGAQMAAVAKNMTGEQAVEDVVAYIATLQTSRPPRSELSGDPVRGYEEFRYCSKCHGMKGQGYKAPNDITYRKKYGPRLAGQHDWYLIRQIKNYKAAIRGSRKDKPAWYMQVDVKGLYKEQAILDLVAYIGTLE